MKYLVTGCAGFIGFSLSRKLLENGSKVIGVDNFNKYYSPDLKKDRLDILRKNKNFQFYKTDISDLTAMDKIFLENQPFTIAHLAAQAGVRYSFTHPFIYERANILGFLNILELAKKYKIKNIVYASSSSVYGGIKKIPFRENMIINQPVSLYGATKASNELFAHTYHHLYDINTIGLRFFTVYGPWGRPDMALFLFTKAILENKPIKVFNYGKMKRDFTYIDDIVNGIMLSLKRVSNLGYEIFNLGCSDPVDLMEFIGYIENTLGRKAKKKMLPLQPGDVPQTYADVSKAQKLLGYKQKVKIEEGIKRFIDWYKQYYEIEK